MFFLWPKLLWLLTALALPVAAYVWLQRRRAQTAIRFSNLGVARAANVHRAWRRHVPPALFLLAVAAMLFASARPVARVQLPWVRSTILLAIDVSLSMSVSDVKPSRLVAAQDAAKSFLREVPRQIEVGLVTFAGSSQVAQRPTLDRESLAAGIDLFQMQIGTAVGNAIVLCLAELFPEQNIALGDMTFSSMKLSPSLDDKARRKPKEVAPVAPGSYKSAAIILLSDGRRTTGIDTLEAAKMAADRGVRIYTVGLGTVNGEAASPEGMALYLQLDEPTLKEVARMTGGEYHYAGTAESLRTVYEQLGSRVQVETRETEVTGIALLAGALLALLAAALSVSWVGRIV
ncbi:VWA domain-containing protein [Variovorax dokdonensis]|uniref:VWA domain-containing protein n=1 Tax=Variovorax dokdonensis TaxID=344883 RepID=A0ABT7NEC4_9BURK|nr:VWA domain-containing protein [Variovorax dokdonensis]MDM0046284.1 VWA domain-containing protein [Variovorax dokdonensis]